MATDSTELTFVRCPACRSLVPAVSTRCRMCGATLDASLGSENTQPPSSGRVRQKTMTTSGSNELAEQIGKVREENQVQQGSVHTEAHTEEEIVAEPQEASQQTPPHDPLSGYIENDDDSFEDEEDDVVTIAADAGSEDFEEADDEVPVVSEPVIPSAEESLEKAKEVINTIAATESKKEESRPRVVVEQGKGRFSKGGLSFSAKSSEPSQRRFDVPKEEAKAKAPEIRREEPKREEPRPVAQEQRAQAPEREVRQAREEPTMAPVARERTSPRKEAPKHSEELGRLFGWLVNYSDPHGTSIELREGRFFVSSSQLRTTDLVLDDATISTPHAMFTIGLDTGIVIQDLKSDRGVFIRERDASTYRREYDSATLEHGDWIRFGDMEFLVSIIAHVGVK